MALLQPQYKYPTIQEALLRAEQQKALYEKYLVGKCFIYAYMEKDNSICYKEMKAECVAKIKELLNDYNLDDIQIVTTHDFDITTIAIS